MAADLIALPDSPLPVYGPSAASQTSGQELPPMHIRPAVTEAEATAVGDALVSGLSAALAPLTSIPALNSLAGAAVSLYLDFNGHFDSVWGGSKNVTTPVFDQDGDAATFSEGELTTIRNVWAQVSEDFAPFNINVTTVEPTSFANGVSLRAAIGGDGSWLGGGAGGVAYIDTFTNSIVNTVYVFPKALANGYFKYVAEATSHEAGHGFGLNHQSLFSSTGALLDDYNPGDSAVAPIMGNSYTSSRGLWWNGLNGDRVMQDDMSVIAKAVNGFGYRADDHGNSVTTATSLTTADASVSASGIIHQTSDVDYYSFTTGAGPVSFSVTVPGAVANLDTRLELRNANGTLIASAAPTTSLNASLTATLATGTYYVVVRSEGYYGDVGQYTLSGTVVPVTVTSVAAPSGLTAQSAATGTTLFWTDNANNETSFIVERSAGDGNWAVLGTVGANTTTYYDPTVVAGQTFVYRVRATGEFSESGNSNEVSVTFAPAAPSGLTATAASGTQVNLAWTDVSGETGYKVERWNGSAWTQIGTTAANVVSFQDTSAVAGATHYYRVLSTNAGGDSDPSSLASVTTPNVVTRPVAPSGLTAYITSSRQVQLAWRDNSTNETAFVVQRSTNGYSWTTLGSVPANSTGAIDTSAARGRVYYYRVFAYNSAGYSVSSNSTRVVTPSYSLRTATTTPATAAPTITRFSGPLPPTTNKTVAAPATGKASAKATQPAYAFTSPRTAKLAAPSAPASEWSASVDAVFSRVS